MLPAPVSTHREPAPLTLGLLAPAPEVDSVGRAGVPVLVPLLALTDLVPKLANYAVALAEMLSAAKSAT